jgi:hypothetical protein
MLDWFLLVLLCSDRLVFKRRPFFEAVYGGIERRAVSYKNELERV